MSTTTTYGYKNPETGDRGSTFYPDLNFNITRLDAHSHNGTDSAILTTSAITSTTISAPSGSWVATSGGFYRQAVTMPVGMDYDDYMVSAKTSAGHVINAQIEKISTSQFYIYTNDNTQTFTVYLGS